LYFSQFLGRLGCFYLTHCVQYLPGAVLFSTGFGIYLVVRPGVVAPPVTTAPLGAVVVVVADQVAAANGSNCQSIAAVGAAPVPAASSPAAAQSVYMSTAAAAVEKLVY
jgi:hypothetical protein